MKLKDVIVKDGKNYSNGAFSLAISELVQGEIKISACVRLVPYTDTFETTTGIDKSIIIPFGSDKDEDKLFISEIRTAIEKLAIAKEL
jgi:hypothetical protein